MQNKTSQTLNQILTVAPGGGEGGEGGGVLKKVLYGEAPPRGPTPYPFIYHFFQKRHPFRIPFIGKRHPFHWPAL